MESLLAHFKTQLEAITENTGTDEEPVLVQVIKTVEQDEGQLDGKVTLQLPAAYFDITDMAYSHTGEHMGVADTEVTIRLAVKKTDPTKYAIINAITKALTGTGGNTFKGIIKESQRKVSYDDLFEYRLTFGCVLYDAAAVPEYTALSNDEKEEIGLSEGISFTIR